MRRHLVAWLVASFVCVTPSLLAAQQGTGEIAGKVTDEQGAVLPGVAIVVTNEETGVFRDVTSGPAGTYFVSQLVPGRYRISAKLSGFSTTERSGLVLPVGKTLTINLSLNVGGLEETVRVTADSFWISVATATIARSSSMTGVVTRTPSSARCSRSATMMLVPR